MPRLETVENCMKTAQMITQGVEAKSSQLLQLPHIRPDMLRHFVTKKVGNSVSYVSPINCPIAMVIVRAPKNWYCQFDVHVLVSFK